METMALIGQIPPRKTGFRAAISAVFADPRGSERAPAAGPVNAPTRGVAVPAGRGGGNPTQGSFGRGLRRNGRFLTIEGARRAPQLNRRRAAIGGTVS